MGCGRERRPRTGRHIVGRARQWRFAARHCGGFDGITKEAGSLAGDAPPDSSKGRRPEEDIAQRSRAPGGSGKAAGAGDARGPSVPASLDLQKRAESGWGTANAGTSGESYAGGGTTAPTEIRLVAQKCN